ncbi:MAG: PASTA domain-containing protein [bacterium]
MLAWGTGCLVGLCLLGALAFVGGYAFLASIVHAPEVLVPSVYGIKEAEAIKDLVEAGLSIQMPIEERESDQREEGLVIEQSPRPGIKVKQGRKIRLTISKGATRILIPNLVANKEEEILPRLPHWELELGQRAVVYHNSVEPGVIIAQYPPPGDALHFGKLISILVSLGPRPQIYVMPNRIGKDITKTEGEFRGMGFTVVVDWQKVDTQEDWNRIIDQDPAPGSRLIGGSEIVFIAGTQYEKTKRTYWFPFRFVLPETVTSQFVIVSISEVTGEKKEQRQTFKVPVENHEIRLPIQIEQKALVEVYDGAVEGGELLYRNTIEAPPENPIEAPSVEPLESFPDNSTQEKMNYGD